MSSIVSTLLLNGIGIESVRRGTAVLSRAGGGFQFDVADPCSGLRSVFVMTALAAPYAYLTLKSTARKWILFALSVPVAVVSNVIRIVTVAVIAELFGKETAIKLYHDYSGYLVFSVGIILLTSIGFLLENRRKAPQSETPS
jgi:exosortase